MSFLSTLFLVITISATNLGPSQGRTLEGGYCRIQDQHLYVQSVRSAIQELSTASKEYFSPKGVLQRLAKFDKPSISSLESCRTYIYLALDNLKNSLICPGESPLSLTVINNIKTWLGGAGADIDTCIEEFVGDKIRNLVWKKLSKTFELIRNSFELTEKFNNCVNWSEGKRIIRRRKHKHKHKHKHSHKSKTRSPKIKSIFMNPNLVVAQDGSGNFTKISDALNAVEDCSMKRNVIYVKKGVYFENVIVEPNKWNVTMIGDGINQTVVSSNLSTSDGIPVSLTATFAVYGNRFIARGMTFRNTAGAIRKQAVALHSSSDQSIFYQCSIEGYQDSLNPQSARQFYRDCYIYGTVDFIFGLSSTVIQSSFIYPRKPLPGQQNVILSHQKLMPMETTGITLHNCIIRPAEDITGVSTFLGRPRNNFSVMAYLGNEMDIAIDPKGWLTLNGPNNLPPPPETVVNVEYSNSGIGANISGRVKWPGVKTNPTGKEARKYTLAFLMGETQWILDSGVPFNLGL